jgi:hypothetical protein
VNHTSEIPVETELIDKSGIWASPTVS